MPATDTARRRGERPGGEGAATLTPPCAHRPPRLDVAVAVAVAMAMVSVAAASAPLPVVWVAPAEAGWLPRP